MNDRSERLPTPQLQRRLGLVALVFYGVGDILGAGIYALVGKVAGMAGDFSWLSFVIALIVASLTGLTYAELGGRFPRSGGEAHFCRQAFERLWIAKLIGWLVFWSGVVSLATISRAFAGYLLEQWPGASAASVMTALLVLLAIINFVGIQFSSSANIVCTLVELSGLLIVIVTGVTFLLQGNHAFADDAGMVVDSVPADALSVLQAAALAFFAFIGFEDMVNVAEEAKNPRRDMPRAIILAAGIAGVLYIAVVLVAIHVVPPQVLGRSKAPLLLVVQTAAPAIPTWLFTAIALFAVANTGLLNFITASRLLYGMSQDRLLPGWLGRVHGSRLTPHWAILTVLIVTFTLAMTGTLAYLAGTTSVLLLLVFLTMNVALIRLKHNSKSNAGSFSVPMVLPVIGAVVCAGLLLCTSGREILTAGTLALIGGLLIFIDARRKSRDSGNETVPERPHA